MCYGFVCFFLFACLDAKNSFYCFISFIVCAVVDMVAMMNDSVPYEVVREKEFAPIKNLHGVDSLDSARELLKANGVEL